MTRVFEKPHISRYEMFFDWMKMSERNSRPEVFCKKDVLRNFAKFTGKHLCQNHFLNKVAGLRPATLSKKRFWHRCKFWKISKNTFFTEHLWATASVITCFKVWAPPTLHSTVGKPITKKFYRPFHGFLLASRPE